MIEHIPHAQIDKQWWDGVLLRSPSRMWYAQSWVLDLTSPGWDALIDRKAEAIMPLTWRSKFGVKYLFQPYGSQQLGVFARSYSDDLGEKFIGSIPKDFVYGDIALNESMHSLTSGEVQLSPLHQQVLVLDRPYQDLRSAYSTGVRRNLKKIDPHISVHDDVDPEEFRTLFQRTTAKRFNSGRRSDHQVMQQVMMSAVGKGQGRIFGIRKDAHVRAAACFMEWEGRSIFYKSAADDIGKEMFGMFRIVDHYIQNNAGSGLLLDMAGSNTPSVARFNAGFGAGSRVYLRLQFNRLPPLLRWLKT
jgi:hypothetical protein